MDKGRIFDEAVTILGRQLFHGGQSLKLVPEALKVVLGKNQYAEPMWRERHCEKLGAVIRFGTFAEFVETTPPQGLGATIRLLQNICRDDPEALDLIDQASRNPTGVNIINAHRPQGTARAQALRSLRDHRPDLHKKVLAGKLSPHAAMIEAGFRRRTFTIPEDVDAAADTLVRRFGANGITALVAALRSRLKRAA